MRRIQEIGMSTTWAMADKKPKKSHSEPFIPDAFVHYEQNAGMNIYIV